MLRTGDILILREREYRRGEGAIMVRILAVGGLRRDDDGYWLPVKCAQTTWRVEPQVRFIEIRTCSIIRARRRAAETSD
ncbi:hypothetical protein GCM10010124_19690 [Pilimelia terevasa]|uniref:Uncharacterized protein n=1 Tax=Pilimelia terevasa TaxID=53372 RepID=A0A8J3BTK2_9ACTN|nr:hypothetical protein [Pilimelia terevasa]GGK27107.1 hypothetical protein GCM10010124_19690 [Pilimelia terevasa]